ncbi:Uncharacterised protein [Streptococcus merionis]|uniref:Uncharacterized protein n=1 Tax=Streptococcus merionis TaxID=400065 RepID=A0A239SS56_9STRE|nr:Uncharacterised protein [Streptococcus merionis]
MNTDSWIVLLEIYHLNIIFTEVGLCLILSRDGGKSPQSYFL